MAGSTAVHLLPCYQNPTSVTEVKSRGKDGTVIQITRAALLTVHNIMAPTEKVINMPHNIFSSSIQQWQMHLLFVCPHLVAKILL